MNNNVCLHALIRCCFPLCQWVSRYLLEKARVVHHGAKEQTYHIFYYLRAAALAQDARIRHLMLERPSTFHYLRETQTPVPGSDTVQANYARFQLIVRTLQQIGFQNGEIDGMIFALATIMHLGNVDFTPSDEEDGATIHNTEQVRCTRAAYTAVFV